MSQRFDIIGADGAFFTPSEFFFPSNGSVGGGGSPQSHFILVEDIRLGSTNRGVNRR
jgi:hypothetical protein